MMKSNQLIRYLLVILLGVAALPGVAQQTYVLSGSQQLKVSGTSTIHDWDMVAKEGIKGSASMKVENGKLTEIKSLNVEMQVKSLKSGKSSMDKNTYEALKAEKFPTIKFEMTELVGISGNSVKARGKLTIAGNSKIIPVDVSYSASGNQIRFTGTKEITFKDFGLDPPTAVFGTIKTGNELTLHFETNFILK